VCQIWEGSLWKWPDFKNGGDMALGAKIEKPHFSKLVNFDPHMSTLLESPREGLQAPKFFGPKFRNEKVIK